MIVRKNMYIHTLKRMREILIYLPDDYDESDEHYPVMFINDGQNAFFDEKAFSKKSWGMIESAEELGIKVIMVAIPCNYLPYKREDEYGPWILKKKHCLELGTEGPIGGEGNKYVNFLVWQLKPYIDKHFRTIEDDYAIVGSSSGGIIAFYAMLKYPKVFKKCAALSTAFWLYEDQFVGMLKYARIRYNQLYMDVGGQEGDDRYLTSNEHIKECLEGKIKLFAYSYFEDDDHSEAAWASRVPYFLAYFYM